MGRLGEYLKSAIKQITGNGYRTFMTMLGIVIGIAAVITVVALGNGMTDYITSQFDSISGSSGYVMVDVKKTTERITAEDMKEIKQTFPDINGVSPDLYPSGDSKIKTKRGMFLAGVEGLSEGGLYARGTDLTAGSYFSEQQVDNAARVAVMLDNEVKDVFGTSNCIGMTMELTVGSKSADYTVVGLRKNASLFSDLFGDPNEDKYYSVEIPYTSYCADFGADVTDISNVNIYASPSILEERTKQIKDLVASNHGLRGTDSIRSNVYGSLGDIFGNTLGYVRTFLMLVSAISLVVGGIGVMNIMLVSVTERTREIGIRKSIGARTEAIMIQFLAESALLTLMGGFIGIAVGILISFFMCKALQFKLIIEPISIITASVFSILIGIFFGIYPARKAAKMKPIDALRL